MATEDHWLHSLISDFKSLTAVSLEDLGEAWRCYEDQLKDILQRRDRAASPEQSRLTSGSRQLRATAYRKWTQLFNELRSVKDWDRLGANMQRLWLAVHELEACPQSDEDRWHYLSIYQGRERNKIKKE